MTRWWDSAVVCNRSIASVAIWTAVSNPNVTSVPDRSLSMVLGTPTAGRPRCCSRSAAPSVSSPPMATRASSPCASHRGQGTIGALFRGEGIGAGRAQDRPSLGQDGPTLLDSERDRRVLEHTEPTIEEADALVTVTDGAPHDDRADDGVQSRTVTPTGEDADSHRIMIERPSELTPATGRHRRPRTAVRIRQRPPETGRERPCAPMAAPSHADQLCRESNL